ncbi:MAG: hypothetical protein LBD45_02445 [Bacteroidales bacterium]|jgi:hypothetical protein|nr:hypothetical protein [Bacteroidales bacterium]
MKTEKKANRQFDETPDELWKSINLLIPHAREQQTCFSKELLSERTLLVEFIEVYERTSPHAHFLTAIDDLNRFGYISNGISNGSCEALLLKGIIAVAEEIQGRPLWEVLHMIAFNKASYKKFCETYLPLPVKIRCFLGSIIARLENKQKTIQEDIRLQHVWEQPVSTW